ncbi:MAG: PTS sugar transporter subunit IIC/EAL domain-containing protein [Clostridiales bacterium]|nr:PTS sugar transporter subunit IIC/EAL domain-containing protein [Clostridiales bacterium]
MRILGEKNMNEKIYDILQKLNYQRHLYSIRISFISMMPLMIVSAYAVILNNLPVPVYQNTMARVFGANWKDLGAIIFNSTLQIAALILVFSICANLSKWYSKNKKVDTHPNITAILGIAVYMIFNMNVKDPFISFANTGVTGFFGAILVSIIVTEIFIRLSNIRTKFFHVSHDPDIEVPMAFSSIVPSVIILFGFASIRWSLISMGMESGLNDLLNYILSLPYRTISPNIHTAIVYNLSTHIMWLFGIHGNNVLDSVAKGFFEQGLLHDPGRIISKSFLDAFVYMGGSGTTLGFLISLIIFSKNKSNRTIFKFAIPNSILNVNEPLIFGIPIVLNPVYAIPFVLTPCIISITTFIGFKSGIIPPIINDVTWSTPIIISGYIATGSLMGSLIQILNLAVAIFVYMPFVRLSDRLLDLEFKSAYSELVQIITSNSSPEKNLLIRSDKIGSIARQLSNEMDTAILNNEMFLQYQPIIDATNHKIIDVEALLRWKHPKYGMINPMLIIAIAEENGLIDRLGLWIIERAVRQRQIWNKEGIEQFKVSVNVSAKQLDSPDFHKEVIKIIDNYGLSGSDINIEVTESLALVEDDITYNNIENLSKDGIGIIMDDFGVGHSSLIYLTNMPIKTIKIDGSLTREILNSEISFNIVSTIYDLCQHMDLDIVMEYVETPGQLKKILELGHFLIQGYLISPPVNGDQVGEFLYDFNKNVWDNYTAP